MPDVDEAAVGRLFLSFLKHAHEELPSVDWEDVATPLRAFLRVRMGQLRPGADRDAALHVRELIGV